MRYLQSKKGCEMNYTKGEWEIKGQDIISKDVENGYICTWSGSKADAHLIASAPELLEACKDIVQAYDVKMGAKAVNLRIEVMRDVINKAGGK